MIRTLVAFLAGAFVMAAQAQAPANPEIQSVVNELVAAWNGLVRPDVALVDVDCSTKAGAPEPIGSKLLLVLTRDAGQWSIAAFHNTPVPAAPIVR